MPRRERARHAPALEPVDHGIEEIGDGAAGDERQKDAGSGNRAARRRARARRARRGARCRAVRRHGPLSAPASRAPSARDSPRPTDTVVAPRHRSATASRPQSPNARRQAARAPGDQRDLQGGVELADDERLGAASAAPSAVASRKPPMMSTSRNTTRMTSQLGRCPARPSVTYMLTSSTLSAKGSSIAPKARALVETLGDKAVDRVRHARSANTTRRRSHRAVQHQPDRQRHRKEPPQRDEIRDAQGLLVGLAQGVEVRIVRVGIGVGRRGRRGGRLIGGLGGGGGLVGWRAWAPPARRASPASSRDRRRSDRDRARRARRATDPDRPHSGSRYGFGCGRTI